MELELVSEDLPDNALFSLRLQQNSEGYLPLQGSVEFLVGLVQHATDWEVSILQPGLIRRLCHFDIIGSEQISSQDLQNEIKKEAEKETTKEAKNEAEKGTEKNVEKDDVVIFAAHLSVTIKHLTGYEQKVVLAAMLEIQMILLC